MQLWNTSQNLIQPFQRAPIEMIMMIIEMKMTMNMK